MNHSKFRSIFFQNEFLAVDETGNCKYEINTLYIEGVIKRKLIDQPRQPTDEERRLFKFEYVNFRKLSFYKKKNEALRMHIMTE